MNIARIEINGVIAAVKELKPIPAGLIGGTVTFDFVDDVWKGLTKTVCFRGAVSKDIVDAEDIVTIPREVLAESARRIAVGVYGTDVNNNVAIPTLWAELGFTEYAADPSGDESTDPALPVWAQLQEEVAEAQAIAKGRAKGYVFDTVEDLDLWLAEPDHVAELAVGDNFYIRALDVPDYWWDGEQKQPLETQKVELSGYVKNTDYASSSRGGVVKVPDVGGMDKGIYISSEGTLAVKQATANDIVQRVNSYRAITPANVDNAVKATMSNAKVSWSDEEKRKARTLLGAVGKTDYSPYRYISNPDESNPITLYGLAAGLYVFDGYFKKNATRTVEKLSPDRLWTVSYLNGNMWMCANRGFGEIQVFNVTGNSVKNESFDLFKFISETDIDANVKKSIINNSQTMTQAEKKAACKWIGTLNVVENSDNTITVTLPSGKTKTVDLSIIEIFT